MNHSIVNSHINKKLGNEIYLVQGLDLRRGAVGKLDVGEVPLRAGDVLRGRHKVVPRLCSDGVTAFQVPEARRKI